MSDTITAGETAASSAERGQQLVEAKVGAFVLITLVAAVAITLTLAQKRHVFERQVVVHTVFHEVDGLREGAPVRLSGVNIGLVSRIFFADRHDSLIHVDMQVSRESLARIGGDSTARIGTQGLLGDKNIELSVGDADAEPLRAGGTIASVPPADFTRLLEQASGVLEKLNRVADNAAVVSGNLANAKTLDAIDSILASMKRLSVAADRGPGLVHAMFYDPAQAKTFTSLLASVDSVGRHVDAAIVHLDGVLAATDGDGQQVVNNLSRAARSVADVAGDLRAAKIIPHLDKAAGDLAAITDYVRAGKGTVGLAIMDPTVYEELLTVLGGVGRSRVLRALVRYAIAKDDGQKVGKAVDESALSR